MKTRLTHVEISKRLGPAVWRLSDEPVDTSHKTYLVVHVTIHDHKVSYGKDRWLIEPVAGAGNRWVETASLVWGDRTLVGLNKLSAGRNYER